MEKESPSLLISRLTELVSNEESCVQWASLIAQLVKNPPATQETPVQFLGREDLLDKLPIPVFLSFSCAQLVKNLPAMWETWVRSLGWEDTLEKGKATHCSILAWRIPWTVQSMGSQRVRHD